jgi:hypothetical protein
MADERFEAVASAIIETISAEVRSEAVNQYDYSPNVARALDSIAHRLETVDIAPIAEALAAALAPSGPAVFSPFEEVHTGDGRAVRWRVRLRLFDSHDELQADTCPESATDYPGDDVIAGLPAVVDWAESICREFHHAAGFTVSWITHAEKKKRLRSIRPTLSRSGGVAIWRIHYTVDGDGQWLALINVAREETEERGSDE